MIDLNLFIILLLGELLILCQIVSRLGKIADNLGKISNNIDCVETAVHNGFSRLIDNNCFISKEDKKCYK